MITRDEAIDTIDSVLHDAATRSTKLLRPEAVATFRVEFLGAYDENPSRFPTTSILTKYVKYRTSAKPPAEAEATADAPENTKRRRMPTRAKKPILDDMSPGGEIALRRGEGE